MAVRAGLAPRLHMLVSMVPNRKTLTRRAAQRGMTLIEVMVVVAIISLVMGGIGLMAFERYKDAQVSTAKNQVETITGAVQTYRASKRGKCPRTLIELRASGYINKVEPDPWGNDYEFSCPGKDGLGVDVTSPGPDGEMDTEDDISNRTKNS